MQGPAQASPLGRPSSTQAQRPRPKHACFSCRACTQDLACSHHRAWLPSCKPWSHDPTCMTSCCFLVAPRSRCTVQFAFSRMAPATGPIAMQLQHSRPPLHQTHTHVSCMAWHVAISMAAPYSLYLPHARPANAQATCPLTRNSDPYSPLASPLLLAHDGFWLTPVCFWLATNGSWAGYNYSIKSGDCSHPIVMVWQAPVQAQKC